MLNIQSNTDPCSEKFCGRYALYHLFDEAIEAEKSGDCMDYDDFIASLKRDIA